MAKTMLAVAVSQLLNPQSHIGDPNDLTGQGKPQKTAKIPKGEMSLQAHDAMTEGDLSVYFDDARRVSIEEYAAMAEDRRYSWETKSDQMAKLANAIWPTGKVTYNECRTVGQFLKSRSETAYKAMLKTIKSFPAMGAKVNPKNGKLILGKLPSKDGGQKSGKRVSLAVWQSTNAKFVKAMRVRMQATRKVIDPDALKAYAVAIAALERAIKLDRKAS